MRAFLFLLASVGVFGQVPYDRLLKADSEHQNWLTYWGDYAGTRHRKLNQINSANVQSLRLEWMYQVPVPGQFETVPLVVDGIMYITAPEGYAFALDARSGRELWRYQYRIPANALKVNGSINRGFAILNDKLYMVTPEGHLLCLEARSGKLVWDVEVAPWQKGYGTTLAPLVVKDKIIVGVAGGEFGIRGLLDAYDAVTGQRAWRLWTIPAKGEPGSETWLADSWQRGGAPTWMTGTYDQKLNLIYWGVGNPGPDLYGDDRIGDNLYSCSMLAIDPDTGTKKWHYQFTPHDTHDWDATETPVLVDLPWKGTKRKLLLQANRNGFYYVLDRVTGEFLMAKAYARQTWNAGFDDKGTPRTLPDSQPTQEGRRVCPGLAGGANWMAPSFNPVLNLLYVPYREECMLYFSSPPQFVEGKPFWGTGIRGVKDEKTWGVVKALNPITGESKWEFLLNKPQMAGTLSTAGSLVFAGDEDGYLMALHAATGKLLWKVYTGAPIVTSPMTYLVQGRQYVSIASRGALLTFALPQPATASIRRQPSAPAQ